MTPADRFKSWLHSHNTKPFVYHEGLLMRDRLADPELDALAGAVWRAARGDLARGIPRRVELCQRRVGNLTWQYIAQKKRRRV